MDVLTDLLRQGGVRRRLLDLRRLSPATALRFPCDRSIGLHVVTGGTVFVHAPQLEAPLALHAGDIALMARGCVHVVGTQASLDGVDVQSVEAWTHAIDDARRAADPVTVISAAYQFWNAPLHPFFREIPGWFVLRAATLPKLGALALSVGLIEQEARGGAPGAETIVHGLMDAVFTYVLREILERQGGQGAGWSQALRDAPVGDAVALMHGAPEHEWTLDELAARVGVSRTGLAERFRRAMGDTPLAYLRTVRMQKAMRILGETDWTLEQVARAVGYQDAFSFSKVFKRALGVSPRDFRQRDLDDMRSPWRLKA